MFIHHELPQDLSLVREIANNWYEPFEKVQFIATAALISAIAAYVFQSDLCCAISTCCISFAVSFLVQNYGAEYTLIRDCTRGIYYLENTIYPLHAILTITAIFATYHNLYIGMLLSTLCGTLAGFSLQTIKVATFTDMRTQELNS